MSQYYNNYDYAQQHSNSTDFNDHSSNRKDLLPCSYEAGLIKTIVCRNPIEWSFNSSGVDADGYNPSHGSFTRDYIEELPSKFPKYNPGPNQDFWNNPQCYVDFFAPLVKRNAVERTKNLCETLKYSVAVKENILLNGSGLRTLSNGDQQFSYRPKNFLDPFSKHLKVLAKGKPDTLSETREIGFEFVKEWEMGREAEKQGGDRINDYVRDLGAEEDDLNFGQKYLLIEHFFI